MGLKPRKGGVHKKGKGYVATTKSGRPLSKHPMSKKKAAKQVAAVLFSQGKIK